MRQPVLLTGAALGFLSVAIGASAEHLLQARVTDEVFRWVMTAIRYHQVGALVITGIGLTLLSPLPSARAARLQRAAWAFIAGTLLFSFSIYLAALSGVEALTKLTPLGGLTLMLGWLLLLIAALPVADDRSTSG